MVSSDETEATTSVHTEPGLSDERDAYEPFRVASRNPLVPAYREWWRRNPLNNLRASGKANLWRRFQAEVVDGKTPLEAAQGDHTRTLEDLKRFVLPSDMEEVGEDGREPPSDEMWWGTPDPAIYKEGTLHLERQQIDEECEKGNIITMQRFREKLKDAKDWEIEVMRQLVQLHHLKHKVLLPCEDGTSISFWDLYKYVHCNPQLEALAARGVNSVDAAQGLTREDRIRLLEEVAPWQLDPEADSLRLPDRVTMGLPWGLLADAPYYSRRPTRWLKGLDGRKDFAYGLYVHEQHAAETLGPKWAGKAAEEVLADESYFDDLISAGPLVGMTLLAVTSRELPLEEATSAWTQRLEQHMDRLQSSKGAGPSNSPSSSGGDAGGVGGGKDVAPLKPCCAAKAGRAAEAAAAAAAAAGGLIPRPVFGPVEDSRAKLAEVARLFDRERLAKQTALLDSTGANLREGSSILLSASPGGAVMVQAISPGKVREQRHYLLGAIADERLSAALFDLFLHPDRALDPAFAYKAAYQSLWYVNGFKSYNADNNPNVRAGSDPAPRVPRLPRRGRGAVWALPAPGEDPEAAAPGLVGGVKRRVMYHQVGAWGVLVYECVYV
ncbi:hypothetical protein MNEG_8456 [Monoraphidium neglectum]|uniref:Uncharacterized protein n=1 Tax=Monoraphidium neglectum TaxID=145388 RepID=A0A0D2KVV1_9CHLO|nr:hypothetical protein MNEG_8456 [Monoraphidium neglectum]KIY99503.1 hypothetical protein MNEG_8456 [Monoraphidium neglectum]|eukprot:XP_013898523.1 hypothetical protein MNEG_8456 [Monoraphidium neglectum]